MPNTKGRIQNLDFLRGFFIFLALWQHYGFYLQTWFVYFFREKEALGTTYQIYTETLGTHLKADPIGVFAFWFFTPWVSQIYLTLAGFNLANRSGKDFDANYKSKVTTMAVVFAIFGVENFLAAARFGEAISFYPIMAWMLILSVIATLYRFARLKGIFIFTALYSAIYLFTDWDPSEAFQAWGQKTLHPNFEFDARPEYFFHSGVLGFLLGYVHYHLPKWSEVKDFIGMMVGAIIFVIYYFFGPSFHVDPYYIFSTEHAMAESTMGLFSVWGIQLFVLCLFLWLERKNIKIKMPFINWLGLNSLAVFASHRIVFIHLYGPCLIFLGAMFGFVPTMGLHTLWPPIFLTAAFVYIIKKKKIHELIFR